MTLERIAKLLEKYGQFPILELCEMLETDNAPLYGKISTLTRELERATTLSGHYQARGDDLANAICPDRSITDTPALIHELEAERAGAAEMREALLKCKQREYLSTADIDSILSFSTAGAEMLERLRKAEARLHQLEPEGRPHDCDCFGAHREHNACASELPGPRKEAVTLTERITTLEAALEEAWRDLQAIRSEEKVIWDRVDLGLREGALGRIGIVMTLIDAAHERIGRLMPDGKP